MSVLQLLEYWELFDFEDSVIVGGRVNLWRLRMENYRIQHRLF